MGIALLDLAANYSVHLFLTPRLAAPINAILMNLCTYWLAVWLFGSALMMLLDKRYVTRKRFIRHIAGWMAYCIVVLILWCYVPSSLLYSIVPILLAVAFCVYAVGVAHKVFATFRKATCKLDNYYSDDAAVYIRWMSVFTYWAIVFGVGQGIFTFVPDRYVYLWIISAIPFYIYLYVSYANYLLMYEHVADAINTYEDKEEYDIENVVENRDRDNGQTISSTTRISKQQEEMLKSNIQKWIDDKEFTKGGLTIEDIARQTASNRTYVSHFVNTHYGMSFREWINYLRLQYAKDIMLKSPDKSVADIALESGYLSTSYFSRIFKETEGLAPGRWIEEMCH
ncbi:helix-turn-helix transcriptional regulator [Prevotella merdae]|uniref:helix-turn-helix transcriptional regulator n=1 Tax=Prevotella merdae TaxID=2079531 RepID=UPI0027E358D6|nr:helix-turn-helix domain-containing protein [uncultured Prevotella sp.]